MQLQRYAWAAAAVAGLLVPLVYYRNIAISSAMDWRVLVKVQRIPGGSGWPPPGSGSSTPAAAAQERFAPLLEAYLRRHEAAVALLDGPDPWGDPQAAGSLRVVVAQLGKEGMGNRLPSLVTAFALALLMDRVLFVDDSMGRYFGIFSPLFDCNYTQSRMEAMMAAPAYKEYRVFRYMEAAFMLEDMNVRYEEATVVRYSSMDYQLPLLASNARYRRWFSELMPNFGVIGEPLLRPERALAAEAAELYAANVPPGSTVVGTHIRLHKRTEHVPPVRWYVDTALAVGLSNTAPKSLRFFIAADDPQVVAEFQANITSTLEADWNVTDAVVFHSAEEFTNRERLGARRDTDLVDMLVLGLCNETVLTYGSSFGYVSAAMALRPPHFQQHMYRKEVFRDSPEVFGRPKERHERVAEDHTFFWKALVAEPCYFDAKRLLTGVFSENSSETHDQLMAAWHTNVNWQQYSQCHWL